ncbi:MAG: NusG domain II-containing protein [Candidatus Izemoplasmatales bacterium]|nr:NusG domain II-containing protein [Candidatus Izemoplasmatales bacterium]
MKLYDKKLIYRDIILISVVLVIVFGVYFFSLFNRPVGEMAHVKYDNKTLFSINLEDGLRDSKTSTYIVDYMPIIDGDKLFINGVEDTRLKMGDGVIVFGNTYVVRGRLGYVLLEYSPIKKMIQVVEETSPYNICSNQGFSNSAPIVCLPNYVTIVFGAVEVDVIM